MTDAQKWETRMTHLALIVDSCRATQIAVVISLLERREDLISQHGTEFDGMLA